MLEGRKRFHEWCNAEATWTPLGRFTWMSTAVARALWIRRAGGRTVGNRASFWLVRGGGDDGGYDTQREASGMGGTGAGTGGRVDKRCRL